MVLEERGARAAADRHTNRYVLTDAGIRIAVFYTKIYNRLLVPLTAADRSRPHLNCAPRWPPSPDTSTNTQPRSTFLRRVKLAPTLKNLATKDR